jgi:tetratricopeptide (TPR) repeat protein
MNTLPDLTLDELMRGAQNFEGLQLRYLRDTIASLLVDEAAYQSLLDPHAQSQPAGIYDTSKLVHEPLPTAPMMSLVVRSMLKLNQGALARLGRVVKRRLQFLNLTTAPVSSYPMHNVFPEVDWTEGTLADAGQAMNDRLEARVMEALRDHNRHEALRLLDEAIMRAEENRLPTFHLKLQRQLHSGEQDYVEQAKLYEEAVAYYQSRKDGFNQAQNLEHLAACVAELGDRAEAIHLYDQAIGLLQALSGDAINHYPQLPLLNEVVRRARIAHIQRERNRISRG